MKYSYTLSAQSIESKKICVDQIIIHVLNITFFLDKTEWHKL